MPFVSVIIPYFNAHQYLLEAIASVQRQTYRDIEIIVVNDGSTEAESLSLLQQLPDVVTVIQKTNGGLASARNSGIAQSSGAIIVTLDSDDKFDKTFIEKAVRILNNKAETGIVSSYVQEFGIGSKVWRAGATDDFSFLTENRIVACCAFRRECWEQVGGYDEQMRSGLEDWEFWIRVTQQGWKVAVIPETLFFYRKTASSMLVNESRPKMAAILDYMMAKHQQWYLSSLKEGIIEKRLLNKNNLTLRRIVGLFVEKLTGKF